MKFVNIFRPRVPGVRYSCPCCRYPTLDARGEFDICPVCFWEDDGQDDHDADEIRGGPNGDDSLRMARDAYRALEASGTSQPFCRPPTDEERRLRERD